LISDLLLIGGYRLGIENATSYFAAALFLSFQSQITNRQSATNH